MGAVGVAKEIHGTEEERAENILKEENDVDPLWKDGMGWQTMRGRDE